MFKCHCGFLDTLGYPLAAEEAGQAIGLRCALHSSCHIADEVNLQQNTVYQVVKQYNQRRTVVPRMSTGYNK